ncbi:MAG: hypothetical protein JWM95_4438 [Gemmatimonadetes bacterium]|nr:hypothetical protein [Gemmatimonadota bacterium]
MATEIVEFTPEWDAAAARFNLRMRAGNAPAAFDLPERAAKPKDGLVHAKHFVAVDGTEVRGGILVLEHPAFVNGAHETVINLQSPLSEAIIDSKYAMVSIQLIRFAVKRCPRAYVVGMGSEENPLPRLLKASGWNVRQVPFFFRILRPTRALTELQPLQRSVLKRIVARVGAFSGAGHVALKFVQRQHASAKGYRVERANAATPADDHLWAEVEQRLSFGVVRDSSTLAQYLAPRVERHRIYRDDEPCGWFSMLIAPMRNHSYFGNMTVATLIDMVANRASHLGALAVLAVDRAKSAGCDLVVSNQLQAEAQEALRAAGFLAYGSNFLMASSKVLSAAMNDDSSFVTRQDGDGLINLQGADSR